MLAELAGPSEKCSIPTREEPDVTNVWLCVQGGGAKLSVRPVREDNGHRVPLSNFAASETEVVR